MHWMHIKQGGTHRSFCVLAWILCGFYIFLQRGGPETLLTWKALIFFLGGIAVMYLVAGTFGAWVHKVLVQALLVALRPPGDTAMGLIRIAGLAVFVGEAVAVYQSALWVFAQNWGAA